MLFYLCALVVIASLLLGGGNREGYLSDALLQLVAIPLFLASLWRIIDLPAAKQTRWAVAFCLAIVLLPLVQLIPLPPRMWTALPNREPSAAAFALVGAELPWMPASVSPHATWLSALSLLPPLAIFLGTALIGHRERRWLSLVVLALGVLSVFVGLTQIAQGPSSPLRFFTNSTGPVGFFSNRNHFAALLYALALFAAAWAVDAAMTAGAWPDRKWYETASIMPLVAGFTVLVVLVAAQAMVRSRAGLGLTIIAVLGAFALAFSDYRSASGVSPFKLLLGATTLAVTFTVQFGLYRILERFAADPLADGRIPFARTTIEAAKAYMPFGSGMGTFVPVYGMFEKPEDAPADAYVNRAHNDVIEVWLEAGALGVVLMALFALWLVLRSVEVWRRAPPGARDIDHSLARAATMVVGLLMAHSFVEYHLRTGAMMAIMAFACALLIDPPAGAGSEHRSEPRGTRQRVPHRGARRPAPAPPDAAVRALTTSSPCGSRRASPVAELRRAAG